MEIKILISGDFCPVGRSKSNIDKEDYKTLFGGFENYSQKADLAITNLECPLTESNSPIVKTGPNIKSSINSLAALKYADFDVVTLANNHIMDYGSEGLKSTIEAC